MRIRQCALVSAPPRKGHSGTVQALANDWVRSIDCSIECTTRRLDLGWTTVPYFLVLHGAGCIC